MELAIPVRLVLDIGTLSATTTREWLGFSRAGECYLPHVVYEEMRFLFDRSPDPDLERVAREFNRFYSSSGWHISDATGHHPELKASTQQGLTKRARVALAVARCAYGEAQYNPRHLVVLVTSDRSILQRIYDLQVPNLTGVASAGLLQWSRNGERPIAVTQKLQQIRDLGDSFSGFSVQPHDVTTPTRTRRTGMSSQQSTGRYRSATRVQSNPTRIQTRTGISSPKRRSKTTKVTKHVNPVPAWLPQLISMLSAFAALAVAGGIIWLMFFTSYLDRFLPKDDTAPALSSHQTSLTAGHSLLGRS
ncbi:MAG: PIN domain-containing protein [Leptolyngbyaceae cyanobacterium]